MKCWVTALIIAVLVLLLILPSVDASDSAAVPDLEIPAAFEVWPAGTRLVIPNRVMTAYRQEAGSWTYASVYLYANYFITAPSFRDPRKETVYVPFVREQGRGKKREVFIDIMDVRRTPGPDSRFVTRGDIGIIVLSSDGKCRYVGGSVGILEHR